MSTIGSRLLYRSATGLEKAAADVDGDRITEINAELIKDVWDPDAIPFDLLPYLSWAMGVEYWNDKWSETTKREWTKVQWLFKSIRGTADGLRMAVHFAGRDVSRWGYNVDAITRRPQTIFSGPSLTKAQREAWLAALPQVRAWRVREQGIASPWKTFYGASNDLRMHDRRFCLGGLTFSPDTSTPTTHASTPSTALSRLKRRVRWVENGVETDTRTTEFGNYFRVHRSGTEDGKIFSGRPVNSARHYIPSDAWKRLLTIQPEASLPWRRSVSPSLQAVTSEPERVKISGVRDHKVFSGFPLWNAYFVPTDASMRIYQRYAVLDPSVHAVRRSPVQFMGVGRYGFPAFTAWADVRVGNVRNRWAAGIGYFVPRNKFWIPHNGEPLRQTRYAAVASKALRDKILLRVGPRPRFIAGGRPVLADIDTMIIGRPYP
jgi:phage tail P2-like protein